MRRTGAEFRKNGRWCRGEFSTHERRYRGAITHIHRGVSRRRFPAPAPFNEPQKSLFGRSLLLQRSFDRWLRGGEGRWPAGPCY